MNGLVFVPQVTQLFDYSSAIFPLGHLLYIRQLRNPHQYLQQFDWESIQGLPQVGKVRWSGYTGQIRALR